MAANIPEDLSDLFQRDEAPTRGRDGTIIQRLLPRNALQQGESIHYETTVPFNCMLEPVFRLNAKTKIVRGDGKKIKWQTLKLDATKGFEYVTKDADADYVGPVNNYGHSIVRDVYVKLNGVEVEARDGEYPLKSFEHSMVFNPKRKLATERLSALRIEDTMDCYDDNGKTAMEVRGVQMPGDNNNRGYLSRRTIIQENMEVHGGLVTSVDLDTNVSRFKRPIPPGTLVEIEIKPSSGAYCLMSEKTNRGYEIQWVEASLTLRYSRCEPGYITAINEIWSKRDINIPYEAWEMRSAIADKGTNYLEVEDVSRKNEMPNQLIITCLDPRASSGSLKKNPFKFEAYGKSAEFKIYAEGNSEPIATYEYVLGGKKTFPKLKGEAGAYTKEDVEYTQNSTTTNYALYAELARVNDEPSVTYYDWANSKAVMLFRVFESDEIVPKPRVGKLRLSIKFGSVLDETVKVMLLCIYNRALTISKSGDVNAEWKF